MLAACFVPSERIAARSRRDRVPYEQWAQKGSLTAIPGPAVDYEVVRQTLLEWVAEFDVQMIAYDPWNATDLVLRLEKQDSLKCVAMRQTFAAMSAPTKSLEKAVLAKQLRHDGDPVLRWCVSNVAVESDASGNLKPSKVASTERIDGVVALIMAVDLMDRHARTPAAAVCDDGDRLGGHMKRPGRPRARADDGLRADCPSAVGQAVRRHPAAGRRGPADDGRLDPPDPGRRHFAHQK